MTPPAAATSAGRLRRSPVPKAPRRVSGPARPRAVPRPAPAAAPSPFARLATLADSRALDALIRGRYWIPLIAVGLLGIVFMQVSMLRMNAGIGASVERTAALERENALLRAEGAKLDAGARIQDVATQMGMVMPDPSGFRYVTAGRPGDGARAAAGIRKPDPVTPGSTLPPGAAPAGSTTAGAAPSAAAPVTTAQPEAAAGATAAAQAAPQAAQPAPQPAQTTPEQAPAAQSPPAAAATTPTGGTAPETP
jgi:hypothetical protein